MTEDAENTAPESVPEMPRGIDPVAVALKAKDTGKSVPAKMRQKAQLPGALSVRELPQMTAVDALDENGNAYKEWRETGESRESIVQEGYGEWPYCNLCQPPRQIEPTDFSRHTNLHTVAQVDDD